VGVAGFYIDLAVVDPERPGHYILGIECDGATYHSAKMARVRDRTRQSVLESLGWSIHRIWSTDWFRNPGEQLGRAVTAIERARVRSKASSNGDSNGEASGQHHTEEKVGETDPQEGEETSEEEPPQERETEIERAEEEEAETEALPYETASLRINVRDALHDEPTSTLGRWIKDVVAEESPVHEEVAMRRVLNASDVSRMGSRIREALENGIRHAARNGWVETNGDVLLDPEQETVPVRDRSDLEGPARDIHHVPVSEIATAAEDIVEVSFGIEKDELVQQVGRQLGFSRIGSNIEDRIGSVIDKMMEGEKLQKENGHLNVGS
jgi:hypothetical protein